ncbi:MAG TPA: sugar ABC transporter permease [Spirochaetota bacterium]|nr:sugar ABC transporter permease [Spirochaetota bacterium]
MKGKMYSRYPIEWLFPVLILVILFTVFPVGYAIYNSLHRIILVLPTTPFVGLKNYIDVVTSIYFKEALFNTLIFTITTAPATVIIALGIARLLLTKFHGRAILRPVILLPWAIPGSVAGILWLWIFHGQWGLLNGFLLKLGIIKSYIPWLMNAHLAKFSVSVTQIWTQVPFASILLMAALTTIPKEIYEAAEVDGAGAFRRLFSITIPQIKGMLIITLIYQCIMGLTSYDAVYSLTGGGPGCATTLLSYYIWAEAFKLLNFGNGAALGVITAVITFALIMAILKAIPTDILVKE